MTAAHPERQNNCSKLDFCHHFLIGCLIFVYFFPSFFSNSNPAHIIMESSSEITLMSPKFYFICGKKTTFICCFVLHHFVKLSLSDIFLKSILLAEIFDDFFLIWKQRREQLKHLCAFKQDIFLLC